MVVFFVFAIFITVLLLTDEIMGSLPAVHLGTLLCLEVRFSAWFSQARKSQRFVWKRDVKFKVINIIHKPHWILFFREELL